MHSKLAIFYHAPSDNVRRIVDALIDGALDPAIESVDVCPVQALAAGPAELQEAELLLMVGSFQEIWLRQCRELGMTLAAGLEAGIF